MTACNHQVDSPIHPWFAMKEEYGHNGGVLALGFGRCVCMQLVLCVMHVHVVPYAGPYAILYVMHVVL